MATEISHNLFTSAMSSQPAFHPAVEPRRAQPHSTQTSGPQAASAEPVVLGSREIQHAVVQMNEVAKASNHRLSFTLDYESNDIIV